MDPGDCEEPTPMKDVETKDLTKARIEVTGCTGDKTNCPVHNTNRPRWLYLAEKDGIDLLMDAMNPRGFREIDLVETLSSFKPFIGPIVDDLADQMARYAIQDKENDEKPMEVDEAEKIEKGAAEETEDSPIPVENDKENDEKPMEVDEAEKIEKNAAEETEDSPIPLENGLPKLSPEHESSTAPEADDETASNTSSTRVTRSSSRTNVVKVAKVKKEKSKPCVKNIIAFLGLDDVKMEEVGDENELKEAMKILLLEMEENIQVKAIGEMLLNADQTREDFRKAVSDGADIKPFLVKDVDYFAHCAEEVELLSDEQLEDFTTELHQLILAFVKIIHSVRMKFLEESPFMMVPKKSKTNEVVAAPTFIEWQRQLLECKSISSLAVFYEIFNERVSWHFAKTGKCYSCRKKAVIEESVVCEICSAMYHLNCAPTKVTSRVYYLCSKSCEKKAAKAAEKKNEKIAQIAVKSVVKVEKDKSVDETKPTVEEMDEDADADNNSSVENHSDEIKPRRRRNANKKPVDYSELENGGKSDSEEPRTRRSNRTRTKKEPGFDDECNFRAISMGLRNGTKVETDLKKQLVECQKVIENAMKQEFGYPFSHPVNEKDAPGYAEAIKKPMDLRTMINKFKNLDYESTVQVWKDCKLIVDNCKAYNYEDDEIIGDADELYEYLKKEFRSIIGDVVDVE
uniref:Bromo domain-containing protein n=1 Tax=Panagrolaimus sp. JU765 TaxID=591449 RepID=A0AC34QCR9_9BILA